MGKGKPGQRTKGNMQPSSSAKAAELLEASQTKLGGSFFGFGKLSLLEENEGETMDNEFSLAFKKLAKKDYNTKAKGLQDLEQLIDEKNLESVVSIIPSWVPAYNKLSLDNDRRVRELCQECLGRLIRRVRKEVAPHLKNILGVWLMSQSDPHAPCATISRKVFQESFTNAKQSEAVDFCRHEVLDFLEEIMFKLTIQSIIETKICEEEEVENRYIRLLSSSLDALTKFIEIVNDRHKDEIIERIKKNLFENQKFWKFSKNKLPQVRKAYFDLVASLLQKYGTTIVTPKSKEQITVTTLCSIDESDLSVIPALWNALIVVISTIDDPWSSINMNKAFLPKLWNTIDKCGYGCASVTHPNIILILKNLPRDIKFDKKFCNNLFEKFISGLLNEKVVISWRDCEALVISFIECCKFYVFNIVEKHEKVDENTVHDINKQLLNMLKEILMMDHKTLNNSNFFKHLAEYIMYMHKMSLKSVKASNNITNDELLHMNKSEPKPENSVNEVLIEDEKEVDVLTGDCNTWSGAYKMFLSCLYSIVEDCWQQMSGKQNEFECFLTKLLKLFKFFSSHQQFSLENKDERIIFRRKSVKFQDSLQENDNIDVCALPPVKKNKNQIEDVKTKQIQSCEYVCCEDPNLKHFVHKFMCFTFDQITLDLVILIKFFKELIKYFGSSESFGYLLQNSQTISKLNIREEGTSPDCLDEFVARVIIPWLLQTQLETFQNICELYLILIKLMPQDKQLKCIESSVDLFKDDSNADKLTDILLVLFNTNDEKLMEVKSKLLSNDKIQNFIHESVDDCVTCFIRGGSLKKVTWDLLTSLLSRSNYCYSDFHDKIILLIQTNLMKSMKSDKLCVEKSIEFVSMLFEHLLSETSLSSVVDCQSFDWFFKVMLLASLNRDDILTADRAVKCEEIFLKTYSLLLNQTFDQCNDFIEINEFKYFLFVRKVLFPYFIYSGEDFKKFESLFHLLEKVMLLMVDKVPVNKLFDCLYAPFNEFLVRLSAEFNTELLPGSNESFNVELSNEVYDCFMSGKFSSSWNKLYCFVCISKIINSIINQCNSIDADEVNTESVVATDDMLENVESSSKSTDTNAGLLDYEEEQEILNMYNTRLCTLTSGNIDNIHLEHHPVAEEMKEKDELSKENIFKHITNLSEALASIMFDLQSTGLQEFTDDDDDDDNLIFSCLHDLLMTFIENELKEEYIEELVKSILKQTYNQNDDVSHVSKKQCFKYWMTLQNISQHINTSEQHSNVLDGLLQAVAPQYLDLSLRNAEYMGLLGMVCCYLNESHRGLLIDRVITLMYHTKDSDFKNFESLLTALNIMTNNYLPLIESTQQQPPPTTVDINLQQNINNMLNKLTTAMERVDDFKSFSSTNFLYGVDFDVKLVHFNTQVATLYTNFVDCFLSDMIATTATPTTSSTAVTTTTTNHETTRKHWDSILCASVSWLLTINQTIQLTNQSIDQQTSDSMNHLIQQLVPFIPPVSKLVVSLGKLFSQFKNHAKLSQMQDEWTNIFEPTVFECLCSLFNYFIVNDNKVHLLSDMKEELISTICQAISYCPPSSLHHLLPSSSSSSSSTPLKSSLSSPKKSGVSSSPSTQPTKSPETSTTTIDEAATTERTTKNNHTVEHLFKVMLPLLGATKYRCVQVCSYLLLRRSLELKDWKRVEDVEIVMESLPDTNPDESYVENTPPQPAEEMLTCLLGSLVERKMLILQTTVVDVSKFVESIVPCCKIKPQHSSPPSSSFSSLPSSSNLTPPPSSSSSSCTKSLLLLSYFLNLDLLLEIFKSASSTIKTYISYWVNENMKDDNFSILLSNLLMSPSFKLQQSAIQPVIDIDVDNISKKLKNISTYDSRFLSSVSLAWVKGGFFVPLNNIQSHLQFSTCNKFINIATSNKALNNDDKNDEDDNDDDVDEIKCMSFMMYSRICHAFPTFVRSWFNNLDHKTSISIDKFTSKDAGPVMSKHDQHPEYQVRLSTCMTQAHDMHLHMSCILDMDILSARCPLLQTHPPLLHRLGTVAKELMNLHSETSLDQLGMNLQIKIRCHLKNLIAIYSLDDVRIELVITFPDNAPLGKLKITTEHNRVTSVEQNCQAWTLQLIKLLNYNNGTLLEGLTKWHKNLDRHFDGSSCMICFSLILNHQGTKYLPKLQCRTCRKKYHNYCLYTWFKTSHKNECPLCRTAFLQ